MASLSRWLVNVSLLPLGLVGCASTKPDPEHLARVDALVPARTGAAFSAAALLGIDPEAPPEPPTGVLTLDEAMARALSRNRALAASAENQAIAQAQLAQAGLLSNPTFNLSFRWPRLEETDPDANGRTGSGWGSTPDVDGQLIFALNQLWQLPTAANIAKVQRFQSGIDLAGQAFDIAEQVESKYRGLAHLVRDQRLSERNVALYERTWKAAEARAKVGVVPTSDVNRARIQWEDAVRQSRKLEAQYRRSARELNWLLGIPSEPQWRLPEELQTLPKSLPGLPEADQVKAVGAKFRLDLQRADLDIHVGQARVKMAKWGFIPPLSLGVDRERDKDGTNKFGPLLSLQLPIFDPGIVGYKLAQVQLRQLQKVYIALEGQVQSDIQSAYTTLALDHEDIAFYRDRIIPQQEENVQLAEKSFQLGNSDLNDLLNTLQNYVSTLQAYEDAVQGYYDDLVQFQRATGLVWPRLIEEVQKGVKP